jgi:hypothetical protein
MPDESAKRKKDELYQLLADVEKAAPPLEKLGQDIVRAARLSRDVAACLRDVVGNIPNDDLLGEEHWKRSIEGWKAWHSLASAVEGSRPLISSFAVTASGNTISTSSVMHEIGPASPLFQTYILNAKTRFAQIVERFPIADDVRTSMRRLRLDAREGTYQTALQLLDESQGAIDHPTDSGSGAVSVLITLRESINVTLSELLRRRPKQEVASKTRAKVESIGGQCGRTGLSLQHFERLAGDAEDLLGRLSGAKQANMSREKIMELFRDGLLFLKAFLDSIDENRLRPV